MNEAGEARALLEEAWFSPEGRATEFRMSLSALILGRLKELNWTQHALAEKVQRPDSFISRILHGDDENITFKTAGLLLWAVGLRAEVCQPRSNESAYVVQGDILTGFEYGEEEEIEPKEEAVSKKKGKDFWHTNPAIYGQHGCATGRGATGVTVAVGG